MARGLLRQHDATRSELGRLELIFPLTPAEDRGLSELRECTLCLGQMLERESALFLGLVKQARGSCADSLSETHRDRNADC
jgi:hypothetical protein